MKYTNNLLGLCIAVAIILGLIMYLDSEKALPEMIPLQNISAENSFPDSIDIPVIGDVKNLSFIGNPSARAAYMPNVSLIAEKQKQFDKAPELGGLTGYLNTRGQEISITDFRGNVVLVDFWTYTCINCIRTVPHLTAWDAQYRDDGLVIIGVHTPEFEFEKKRENVEMALTKYNILYPVVQDNNYQTWTIFQNRFWPHKYLIDKDGFIRYDHIGEGSYDETEQKIQELLSELGSPIQENLTGVADTTPIQAQTPELYAGYDFALPRGQDIGNPGGIQAGKTIAYTLPSTILPNTIYLSGSWKSNSDDLEAVSAGSIILSYMGSAVNIVADGTKNVMNVHVDGQPAGDFSGDDVSHGRVVVDEPRLYNVVRGDYGRHILTLEVEPGFRFSAFTFG